MAKLAYKFLFALIRTVFFSMPATFRGFLFARIASLSYILLSRPRNTVVANLDLAYGSSLDAEQKESLARKIFLTTLENFAYFIKTLAFSREELLSKVSFENAQIIDDLKAQGRPIILITGHYGNWEMLPPTVSSRFGKMTAVGRELDSAAMNKIITDARERFDVNMVNKDGAMRSLVRALKEGMSVAILVDQNTSDTEGILIDFFGKKARHTPVAAVLARRFDAAIVPVFIHSLKNEKFQIRVYEPIEIEKTQNVDEDIRRCVQAQATVTEKVIRENPQEWFWFHKRWKNQYEAYYNEKR